MYRKNIIYTITVFLGILEQLTKISLFMVPIKSIKIIAKGQVDPQISWILSLFNIDIVSNTEQYFFLSLVFLFLVFIILTITTVRNELIKKIKIRKLNRVFRMNDESQIDEEHLVRKLKTVDEFINFRTTLIFSSILLIFVIYYNYLISLIIIFNCLINYILTTKIISSKSNKKEFSWKLKDEYIKKIKNDYKEESFIKPIINTFTMFCIMTLLLIREDISISIIFIFLIRIYLNKINDIIYNLSSNKKFKTSIINHFK